MYKTKKIYMDDRCYCRPLDEGGTDEEKRAIIFIMRNINKVNYKIMGSTWVEDKICKISDKRKRKMVRDNYKCYVDKDDGLHMTSDVSKLAKEYRIKGLFDYDSYHLAFAESGKCHYLLTTDEEFIKKCSKLDIWVKVISPLNLYEEVQKWSKRK